jgi:hypothetical protein
VKFGKRDKEASDDDGDGETAAASGAIPAGWTAPGPGAAPADAPASLAEPPAAEAEPVVEGSAIELPYEPPVAATPLASAAGPATAQPHPIDPEPVVSVADGSPHPEPGLIPGDSDVRSGQGGAWPDPAFDLAERPEILVGAAFAGGILLALILRRLGH